ncbi:MAG: hypothetical protein M3Q13_04080, partial [Pseudomonadota bacterium]|nr:hypothetical protein [Pseudomonadota bacterium]
IYGFPYAIVDGTQPKLAVTFNYWDESDGVDPATGQGVPFYPIPAQAITQPHWVEGGPPGNVDARSSSDRHLLMIDCSNNHLYELVAVYNNAGKWIAGSGAFFDMNRNARRPEGWTSADASGMAIFPGLVRYDEAANAAVSEIKHAFRVTVRATNGYVYPASHVAGSTSGALPLGARLRLKTSVNGVDPALRSTDPTARKIFRAMQKYGLIVADNGSDMYISGTFDTRWNNSVLNPAFSTVKAGDFEVIQRGWTPASPPPPPPPPPAAPALSAVNASPNPVTGGASSTGTVTLDAAAPANGAQVSLSSPISTFSVPASVTVTQGSQSANFPITTSPVSTTTSGTLSAAYNGVTKTTTFTVNPASAPPPPPSPASLSIADVQVAEGKQATFMVRLSRALSNAVTYTVATANGTATAGSDYFARSRAHTIAAGQTSKAFTVNTRDDRAREANETFTVNLSGVTGATVADGQATGTILDND